MLAAGRYNLEGLETLLASGADKELVNRNGETALFIAASQMNAEGMQRLIEDGADVYVRNNRGDSILDIIQKKIIFLNYNDESAYKCFEIAKGALTDENPASCIYR